MMATIIEAIVDENHELRAVVPESVPPGRLRILLLSEQEQPTDVIADEPEWTEDEIREMLSFRPVPARDIVAGGWEHMGITDGQAWVEARRKREQEERRWPTSS
jgi:hypothetical protein